MSARVTVPASAHVPARVIVPVGVVPASVVPARVVPATRVVVPASVYCDW